MEQKGRRKDLIFDPLILSSFSHEPFFLDAHEREKNISSCFLSFFFASDTFFLKNIFICRSDIFSLLQIFPTLVYYQQEKTIRLEKKPTGEFTLGFQEVSTGHESKWISVAFSQLALEGKKKTFRSQISFSSHNRFASIELFSMCSTTNLRGP